MRSLSSAVTTFAYKTFLPVVVTSACTVAAFAGTSSRITGVAIAAGLVVVFGFLTWRLKTVKLDRDVLVISGYFRSIRVPLHQVASVSGSTLVSPDRVWITFSEPTQFGFNVVFLPVPRFLPGLSVHPIANELSALCAEARVKRTQQTASKLTP